MARVDEDRAPTNVAGVAHISLMGSVDDQMATKLRDDLANVGPGSGPLIIDLTTLGGDPEMARRMILEIESARERIDRKILFHGKSVVYSAGVTFMAGFAPQDRFLSREAMLLIHCRQLKKTVEIEGPLRPTVPMIKALLHELEIGIQLEEDNFAQLIEGTDITMDELLAKALYNWYLSSEEAVQRGLVAGIVAA